MSTHEPTIQMEEVWFGYGESPVLKDVSVSIPSRDFVCIIGPNGGGKTTLLKLILGQVEPQHGRVHVMGRRAQRARGQIGYMAQHIQLDARFPVSAMDVVLMGRLGRSRWMGPYRREDKRIAEQCLAEVGVGALARRPFSSISGGQRQRVLIARALACEPAILLLDEPTANLDPPGQEALYATLRELNRRLTVIMVSHDIGFVSLYFKTALCVHGRVHMHPSSELTSRQVADIYGREVRLIHAEADEGGRQ